MPNKFSLNQEKIKNNLQTNLPLKIIQKTNPSNIEKFNQIKIFHGNEERKKSDINNKNSNTNINLKYSGRSYSEDSENNASKNEKLNKYDLTLSESISENSDKIKSIHNANKKNFNRSSE